MNRTIFYFCLLNAARQILRAIKSSRLKRKKRRKERAKVHRFSQRAIGQIIVAQ